jgi:3-hydroxyisobutyrate dehydrogenase-like beta-hydroxyacid dehydrogenase
MRTDRAAVPSVEPRCAMDIGFIGVGRMGGPMARRLLSAGHRLAVCDVNADACARLAAQGAETRSTPSSIAADYPNIITSLPGPKEVELVMRGADGLLSAVRRDTLVLETSTIGPALSRALARQFSERGATYLDCPVSNGVQAAQAGTLTFMIGGDSAAVERAKPILSPLASEIFHMGPIGSGNIAKLINQSVYLGYVAAFCESMRLGRSAGLDVQTLLNVLRKSVAGNPLMTGWEKRIETGDLTPGFRVRRVLKDLSLCDDVCSEQEFAGPIFEAALQAFRDVGAAGHMEHDLTALFTAVPDGRSV